MVENCAKYLGAHLNYRVSDLKVSQEELLDTNILFISTFPKSGSTYLSALLRSITGFPSGEFVQFFTHNEQDIFEIKLQSLIGKNVVVKEHTKGTCNNIALMKKYNISPVVLLRNIFDVVVSTNDHFRNEDDRGPSVYIHPEFHRMSEEEKFDFLIANCLPWYFSFFASWRDAQKELPVHFVTYERLFSDQLAEVKKIVSFWGLSNKYDDAHIISAIESMPSSGNRKNVGRAGRGRELMNAEQQSRVLQLAKSWKISDNSMKLIGLEI